MLWRGQRGGLCVLLITILLTLTDLCNAQVFLADSAPRMSYGAYVDLDQNIHTADFQQLPGVPSCCPRYSSGSGMGPSFGLMMELPLRNHVRFDLRAGFASANATLSTDENSTGRIGDAPGPIVFRHSIAASLSSLGVEPMMVYDATNRLAFELGARAGLSVTNSYAQKEQIVEPADIGTFGDGTKVRNQLSGTIPGASKLGLALTGGLRYTLPMSASGAWTLAPEVTFAYGLNGVASGVAWHAHALRAGVVVLYTPPERAPEPPPPPPTPREEPPVVATPLQPGGPPAIVIAHAITDEGRELPNATLRVEEFPSIQMRPWLMYVFFDDGSAKIPDRYTLLKPEDASRFTMSSLHRLGTMAIYHHFLNVLGYRLQKYPTRTITITGCNSDRGAERGDRALSKRRAEAVRDYLRDVWGIDPSRMPISSRDLPAKPTNPDVPDGIEENRRVEIESEAPEITDPVITNDTLRTATPPTLDFRPTVRTDIRPRSWTLSTSQAGVVFRYFNGTGVVPERFDWNVNDDQATIPTTDDPLETRLTVESNAGESYISPTHLTNVTLVTIDQKRRERRGDRETDYYSLILFDFDKADLGKTNKRLVDFIRGRLGANAEITITGYSDRTGTAEHNVALSRARGESVAQTLGVDRAHVHVTGNPALLYTNDLPEGRFFCRTVQVKVEMDIKE